jgi:SAM-dependent methyltransferase
MVNCPITNSAHVKLVEKIATGKIVGYYDLFGIETRDIFEGITYVLKYHSIDSGYYFFYPFSVQGPASLYEKLEKIDWYYEEQKWEHVKSLELIGPTDRVLEIGCGQGSFLLSVKNRYGGEPIGLELNQHAVAKAVSAGLKVYNRDLNSFSLENREAVDVICLFQVLEHIAEPIPFLQHTLRMLKPGGRLIICVPDNDALINKDNENPLNLPPHHMGMWNKQSLLFLGKVLQIDVELLEHEPLQRIHVDWYVRTLLKRIVGKRLYFRIISKTNIPQFMKKKVQAIASTIHGHSILSVYRK